MHNLNFKYARAENFLCFGPDGIELNFESYGNIVCIFGKNLDVDDSTNEKTSSNGAGKSSIPEIVVYALYGKTIKKPKKLTHADAINYQIGKKLYVELCWDDYRLVRTRKPDSLRLWKSPEGVWDKSTEITRSGAPATQEHIQDIIGLNYETFVNIYIFSDDPTMSFLEADTPTKREIVENLLSLQNYRNYLENAKTALKQIKDKIQILTNDYKYLLSEKESCTNRIAKIEQQEIEWKRTKERELQQLQQNLSRKVQELESSDIGAALAKYNDAQEQIKDLKIKIPDLDAQRNKLKETVLAVQPKFESAKEKQQEYYNSYKKTFEEFEDCNSRIKKSKAVLSDIEKKTSGGECPYCLGKIQESNFASISTKMRTSLEIDVPKHSELEKEYEELKSKYNAQCELVKKVELALNETNKKINNISNEITKIHSAISDLSKIKEPQVGTNERLLEEQISTLKEQVANKKMEMNGESPFTQMKESSAKELIAKLADIENKKLEIGQEEAAVPYYEFWVKSFGDKGIRKYVVDGVVPILNEKITYWLQFLVDNKITLAFDNELQETIDRYPFNGRPYVYWGMSGGQKQRLNLSVSQAWAHIMMFSCGTCPSIVFLDEVSKNVDELGVEGIYRMICELSKDKKVFVIDHNPNLLRLLAGCDKIQLEMKNEITRKI